MVILFFIFSIYIYPEYYVSSTSDSINSIKPAYEKDSIYGEGKIYFNSKTAKIRQNFKKKEEILKKEVKFLDWFLLSIQINHKKQK